MARINIRELPDDIHKAISESAERNNRSLEGEVRTILQTYVSNMKQKPAPIKTLRQSWQKGVGDRLDQLFACVRKDQVYPSTHAPTLVGVARLIGEDTPAHLLDCLEGIAAPSFEMIDRVAVWSGGSSDWLISGMGPIFPVMNIGSEYRDFFLHERERKDVIYKLLRVCGGRSEGTILCIRHDTANDTYVTGFISEHFMLTHGMGAGGHGNLNRFIRFLKTECGNRVINALQYEESEIQTELGAHHPKYYLRSAHPSDWLSKLFDGKDPANWLEGYSSAWKEVGELPFGPTDQI